MSAASLTADTDPDHTSNREPHRGPRHRYDMEADRDGTPLVTMRALTEEDLVVDGDPNHPSWDYGLTDINQPVTIEPLE